MPIQITSKRDMFRRCGLAHPKEATVYQDDRWTAKQLAELRKEPMLTVTKVAAPEADKVSAAKAAADKATADKAAADKAAADKAAAGPKEYTMNARAAIKAIRAAETLAALDELAAGEERASVMAAITARRSELEG